MSQVLVTGSSGRLGAVVVRELAGRGHRVVTADRSALPAGRPPDHLGDLGDPAFTREAVQGATAVVHLASRTEQQPEHDGAVISANVAGTANVLLAAEALGVRRVVVMSSINALGCVSGGRPVRLPITDDYPAHPTSGYQISKSLVEQLCAAFARRGLETVCLRPTWVTHPEISYGDHASVGADLAASAVPDEWAIADLFAWIDARDVATAVHRALTVPLTGGHALLLAAADTHVAVPTATLVRRYLADVPWTVPTADFLAGAPAVDPYRSLVDCSAAAAVLGWRPAYCRTRPTHDGPRPDEHRSTGADRSPA